MEVRNVSKQCARCDKPDDTNFCVRCKEAVCNDCWNLTWNLCHNCGTYKEGVRWDVQQLLNHTMRTAHFASQKLGSECGHCLILRDQLLYLLKSMKNVEFTAQFEGLFNEQQQATKARTDLTELVIRVLIQQGIQADSDLWRHL